MDSIVDLLKSLSDETRLQSVTLVHAYGELCVCELSYALDLSQPKISRHLARLRTEGILETRRDGQWVLYSIHPEIDPAIKQVIDSVVEQVKNTELYKQNSQRLDKMQDRPRVSCVGGCN